MSVPPAPRVLFCGFAFVPGRTAQATRVSGWLRVFGTREIDALSLKGARHPHIQRISSARLLRVPNVEGRPVDEQRATYRRALERQLTSEAYDLLWCSDPFSGRVALQATPGNIAVVVELGSVADVAEIAATLDARGATHDSASRRPPVAAVIVPSRAVARAADRVFDARRIILAPTSVDRSIFRPPSMELAVEEGAEVAVFARGNHADGEERIRSTVRALRAQLDARHSIAVLGPVVLDAAGSAASRQPPGVRFVDPGSALEVAEVLRRAAVVVVLGRWPAKDAALPHRALEALACGRATVLAGSSDPASAPVEAASLRPFGVSLISDEPTVVASTAADLIADSATRAADGAHGSRYAEAHADLEVTAQALCARIAEQTGIHLRQHAPRDDDPDTMSRTLERPRLADDNVAGAVADSVSGARRPRKGSGPDQAAPREVAAAAELAPLTAVGSELQEPDTLGDLHVLAPSSAASDEAHATPIDEAALASRVRATLLLSGSGKPVAEPSAATRLVGDTVADAPPVADPKDPASTTPATVVDDAVLATEGAGSAGQRSIPARAPTGRVFKSLLVDGAIRAALDQSAPSGQAPASDNTTEAGDDDT